MRRIFVILALAVLLFQAPHKQKPALLHAGALLVEARALPLSTADPALRRVGLLDYMEGWELRSAAPHFGGISALQVGPGNSILGLSDSGILMGFSLPNPDDGRPFIAPLPVNRDEREKPWWIWDSESMTSDPDTGRHWVGFELQQRICRYSPGFARVETCRIWPQIETWPKTGSLETLARFPDGRFIAIGEMAMTSDGNHDALMFAGDPTERTTPAPVHLRYMPPQGYRPTDAVALDDRHLLVLNRRLTIADLFTATIALVELPSHVTAGTKLRAQTIARLAPPLLADNFEGLAISREGDRTMLWVVSDDNHEFFQRTLLLKFALPPGYPGQPKP